MTDDLVKRLRIGIYTSADEQTLRDEAADRIEKLEAANLKQSCIIIDAHTRIEKLEAALREIANGQRDADKSYVELLAEVRIEARKALEGEIMESETGPSPKLNVEYYAILYWQERYEKSKKRIEKLEAALIDILKVPRSEASWGIALVIARKALEGKDD